jgi:hypothetical protein
MKNCLKIRKFIRFQDGATAVEFALIALPLLALTFGIFEFARLMLANMEVGFAADLTYRKVVLNEASLDEIELMALSEQLEDKLVFAKSVIITTAEFGNVIKIDAVYNYEFLINFIYAAPITLQETLFATIVSPAQ